MKVAEKDMVEISFSNSGELYEKAKVYIPEGVSSPGRKFSEVKANPIYVERAEGAYIYDVDGNRYVDFMNGLGPIILGHAYPAVCSAIQEQAKKGTVYGISSKPELQLAKKIVDASPGVDQVRFVCSGTEATMSAIRLAKYKNGKPKLLKFKGSYHGHADIVLGSTIKTRTDLMRGVDDYIHDTTLMCDYNNLEELRDVFNNHSHEISVVIVEPISSNMGLVKPNKGFLEELRQLCDDHNVILIFDEVVTGFRFCYGSVANIYGVIPDMVVYGKIIGGGLPVGAYGGKKEIMSGLEEDEVFQGGTFSSNPLTMAAGNAVLDILQADNKVYSHIKNLGDFLCAELNHFFQENNIGYFADSYGSLVSLVLNKDVREMSNYADTLKQDRGLFSELHYYLLAHGFMLAPTIDEPLFISYQHTKEQICSLVGLIKRFFKGN